MTTRATAAVRWALGAWLVGWFCKAPFWIDELRGAFAHPIVTDRLPALLTTPAVALALWLAPAPAVWAWMRPSRRSLRVAAPLMLVAALLGSAHVETFSDATFATSFWTAAWILWLAWNLDADDAALARHGQPLARAVVALIFLGGALGKLTAEYWDGSAFYALYFAHKTSWPLPWLRAHVGAAALARLAAAMGQAVCLGELALATGPIWPHRLYTLAVVAVIAVMIAISPWQLLSVLACLGGVLVAADRLHAAPRRERG